MTLFPSLLVFSGSNLVLPFYGGSGGRLNTDGGGLISGLAIKAGVGGFDIEGWDLDRRALRRFVGDGRAAMVGTCGGNHAAGCPDRNLVGISDGGKVGGGGSAGVEDVMPARVLMGWRDWALACCLWFWAFLVSGFLFFILGLGLHSFSRKDVRSVFFF